MSLLTELFAFLGGRGYKVLLLRSRGRMSSCSSGVAGTKPNQKTDEQDLVSNADDQEIIPNESV
jgi:hypothetical protein